MSCLGVCYDVWFLLPGSHLAAILISMGSTIGTCVTTTLWSTQIVCICAPGDSLAHMRSCTEWLLLPTAYELGEHYATHSAIPQPIPSIMLGPTTLEAWQRVT